MMNSSDLQLLGAKNQSAKSIIDIFEAHETLYNKYPVNPLGLNLGSPAATSMTQKKLQLADAVEKLIDMQNTNAIEASFAFAYLSVHEAELPSESDKLDVIKNPQNYLSDDYRSYADYLSNPYTATRIKRGMSLLP